MNKKLFAKIVHALGDRNLDDFGYWHEGKNYCFKEVGDNSWTDEGKYQYSSERGQLIEEDNAFNEIQSFGFGVARSRKRSGVPVYHYQYGPYHTFEIKEVLVPMVMVPAHIEFKWEIIDIGLGGITNE